MDDNDGNEVFGIEFQAEIGKGFSSTISKVKKEINKIPEERTLRYSAKANFKQLDKDMKANLKNFDRMSKKMSGKTFFGMPKLGKNLFNSIFGDRNKFKDIENVFDKTTQLAIKARQKQASQLKNLTGQTDIDSTEFTDESLFGQTSKAYAEQAQAMLELKDRLAELQEQRDKLFDTKQELDFLPNQEKILAKMNAVEVEATKLKNKIESYSKINIAGENAQKQINDVSDRIYAKTEQMTRLAIGHFNRTGTDKLYSELRNGIESNMQQQQDSLKGVVDAITEVESDYIDWTERLNDLQFNEQANMTAEEKQQAIEDAEKEVKDLEEQLNILTTRENKIEIYIDVNKKQLDKMSELWADRANINPVDNKKYDQSRAENSFAQYKNTLTGLQDTLSNRVGGTVSSTFIQNLQTQLDQLGTKKAELNEQFKNTPNVELDIANTIQQIETVEQQIKDVEKQIKNGEGTSANLQRRWELLNQELSELRTQWQLLNGDMNSNPFKDNFMSQDMQSANNLWDGLNARMKKYGNIFKSNNAITRLGKRVLTQIRNTIANMINPLNLWNKGWNSWLDRVENKRLKNTFEMIKYNLVTAFEPLFEKFAQFLLKLAQVANIFTKKFVGVDLFDSKDWKKNKAMIDQLTASFDELHANGENTDTIFDSGTFKMDPLSSEQVKFWEKAAETVSKAWDKVKKVIQWVVDNWKWLVAAWATYKIGKGLLNLLGWGKNFGGLLKGLSLSSLISSLSIAIGAASILYGIFQDIKLAKKWNQMTPEEREKTANKGDTTMGIGGALVGGGIGFKAASALGLTSTAGILAGATFGGGIALGISGTANAITAATNGNYEMVEKESTKAGAGIGMAAGTVIGVKLGASLGAFAGPVGAAVGAVVGAVVGLSVGKIATFFGDVGGEFSKLKISTEDLQWATDQYNTALGTEYQALQNLQQMEQATGQSGEELYKAVENGTIKYGDLTTEQKLLIKAYEDYQTSIQNTAAALKTQTDYENSILKTKAEETGDFSEFIDSMYNAHEQGIYSSEELQDRLSQVYAELSKDEREVFLSQMPEDMRQGVEDGASKYYSGWEKFKINAGKLWEDFKTGWGNFWSSVGDKLGGAWEGIKTIAGNAWNGLKTTASNVWNSIKIEAGEAWEGIKNSAIGQKVQEIASNVSTKFNEVKTKAGEIWGNVKETVSGKAEELKNKVQEKWNILKTKTGEAWENIKTKASTTWDNIKNSAIGQKVQDTVNNAKNKFNELKNNLSTGWNTLKSNASTAWNNIKTSIVDAAKGAWEKAKGFFDKIGEGVRNAWEGFKGWASDTGNRIGNFFGGKGFKTDEEYAEYARKKGIPGYAVGTNYVPNDQLAMVHKGEAIIPAKYNKPYTPNTGNSEAVISQMTQEIANLRSLIQQGIPVKGEFRQRGSDLVAVVQKGKNKNGNQPLSNPAYAR